MQSSKSFYKQNQSQYKKNPHSYQQDLDENYDDNNYQYKKNSYSYKKTVQQHYNITNRFFNNKLNLDKKGGYQQDEQLKKFLNKTYNCMNTKQTVRWIVKNKLLTDNIDLQAFLKSYDIKKINYILTYQIDSNDQIVIVQHPNKEKQIFKIDFRYNMQFTDDINIELQRGIQIKTDEFKEPSQILRADVRKSFYIPELQIFLDFVFDIQNDMQNIKSYLTQLEKGECQYAEIWRNIQLNTKREEGLDKLFYRAIASTTHIDPYKRQLYEISKYIFPDLRKRLNVRRLRDLTNKVITLDRSLYNEIYPPYQWFISKKIDGQHVLIANINNELIIISESHILYVYKSNINEEFVLEGEIIVEVNQDGSKTHYNQCIYLIDLVSYDNELRQWSKTIDRLKHLEKYAKKIAPLMNNIDVLTKKFVLIEDMEQFRSTVQKFIQEEEVECDGILFISSDTVYYKTKVYKWKPVDKQSIDFLAVRNTAKENKDKNSYILLCSIQYHSFLDMGFSTLSSYHTLFQDVIKNKKFKSSNQVPVHFQPLIKKNGEEHIFICEKDINMKIVELLFLNDKWNLLKIRDDRQTLVDSNMTFGNNHAIAEQIWSYQLSPIPIQELIDYQPSGYFCQKRDPIYDNLVKFHSVVKYSIFGQHLPKNSIVLDIGCGQGNDLWKYKNQSVKNLILNDVDILALTQLVQRRYKLHFDSSNHEMMKTKIIQGDITTTQVKDSILSYIGSGNIDCIVCAYSFHYFTFALKQLAIFFRKLLKDGAIIILIVMDGKAINDEFNRQKIQNGQSIIFEHEGRQKYMIKKLFDGDQLLNHGQKISIKLPFSNKEVEEQLVNVEYLQQILSTQDIYIIDQQQFASYAMEKKIPEYFKLDDIDQQYTSLNQYIILQKQVQKKHSDQGMKELFKEKEEINS